MNGILMRVLVGIIVSITAGETYCSIIYMIEQYIYIYTYIYTAYSIKIKGGL